MRSAPLRSRAVRAAVLLLALALPLAACEKPTGRVVELGEYAPLTPARGAYIRMINAEGERWRATFDADTEEILIRGAWQKEGSPKITMKIGSEPTARIWKHAQDVLAAGTPAFHHNPELRLEMAVSDGAKATLIKTQGMFTDGPAKALFEGVKGFVPDPDDPANRRR